MAGCEMRLRARLLSLIMFVLFPRTMPLSQRHFLNAAFHQCGVLSSVTRWLFRPSKLFAHSRLAGFTPHR